MSRYDIVLHTWGCKVNTYDTGLLENRFRNSATPAKGASMPFESSQETSTAAKPRVHVLNTCAVTSEATKEAARKVRQIKAQEPLSKVVVTGCGAQVDGGVFDTLPGADLVVANSHKGQIEELIDRLFKGTLESKVFRSNIFRKDDLEEGGGLESDHTRSFLKIQDGCNSFCSYCVIPFARGKSRSIPVARLLKRVTELEAAGAKEVVITGVHIADYEDTSGSRIQLLDDLIERICRETKIPRIRISSLEPVELSPRLLSLYKTETKLCRHFHLSIQSANTETLKRMRRRYTADDVETVLTSIGNELAGAFVGLDLIVGFPGETEEEFQDTYARLARLPWTRIHVFPYSERPGTKAIALEGSVPLDVRRRRAQQVRELSRSRYNESGKEKAGTLARGLVLSESRGDFARLLTEDYWNVHVKKSELLKPGTEIDLKLGSFVVPSTGRMDGWFEGVVTT